MGLLNGWMYYRWDVTRMPVWITQINSKYSEPHAQEVLEWIRTLTGEPDNVSGDPDNVYEHLRDGTLLCKYVLDSDFVWLSTHFTDLIGWPQTGQRDPTRHRQENPAEQDGVQVHGKHQHVFRGRQVFRSAHSGTFPDGWSVGKAEPQLCHHLSSITRTQSKNHHWPDQQTRQTTVFILIFKLKTGIQVRKTFDRTQRGREEWTWIYRRAIACRSNCDFSPVRNQYRSQSERNEFRQHPAYVKKENQQKHWPWNLTFFYIFVSIKTAQKEVCVETAIFAIYCF